MTWKVQLKDAIERIGATLVQSVIVYVVAANGQLDVSRGKAILAALFPAVANIVLQVVTAWTPKVKTFIGDLTARTIRTFAVALAGTAAAAGFDVFNVSAWKAAGISAVIAGLAVVKALIAKFLADKEPQTPKITPASLASCPATP